MDLDYETIVTNLLSYTNYRYKIQVEINKKKKKKLQSIRDYKLIHF